MLSGSATATNTHDYIANSARFDPIQLGETGLAVSPVGFGGYRIRDDQPEQKAALRLALQQGINLIDSSSNYTNGRSEMLIGTLLNEMVTEKAVQREEVVLVSKAGYLQGDNYEIAEQRKQAGRPFPNLIKFAVGLDHCIHPEFLADQLERSRQRLQVECIDIYLLHNPEYYLKWARRSHIPLAEARAEYYRRIQHAFEFLETAVAAGHIQYYGISSNTFPSYKNQSDFTSLETVWEIAESLSPTHHFRVIQLPLNLLETGAATEENCSHRQTTLQFAHDKQLGVLVNRPLNAIHDNQIMRLADVLPPSYPATIEDVSTAVDSLKAHEVQFKQAWHASLTNDDATNERIWQYLAIGHVLQGQWRGFGNYHNWRDAQNQFFVPRAQSAISFLTEAENSPAELINWVNAYVEMVNETIAAVSAFYQETAVNMAQHLQTSVATIAPAWEADTLSQTAVRALRSTEGVSCVLVGMRRPEYVEEILADLEHDVEKRPYRSAWEQLRKEMLTL